MVIIYGFLNTASTAQDIDTREKLGEQKGEASFRSSAFSMWKASSRAQPMDDFASESQWSWNQWMKGRYRRRIAGNLVAPVVIRRIESKGDPHLRATYDGNRGPGRV